jgi:hypothetical protein
VMIQIIKLSQNIDIVLPRPILSLLRESRRGSDFSIGDTERRITGGRERPISDARRYIKPLTMARIHEHFCLKVKLFFYVY